MSFTLGIKITKIKNFQQMLLSKATYKWWQWKQSKPYIDIKTTKNNKNNKITKTLTTIKMKTENMKTDTNINKN